MQQRLLELWYGESRGVSVLQPLSWLYGAAVAARRQAYERGWVKSHDVGRPVIVVGNLTVGGTGKTPLTIWLANRLRQRGYDVGLVSRGYGREQGGLAVVTADSSWREVGDEPLILQRRTGCTTLVASDRVAGARALVERGAKVILADDGLQHLALRRNCEIVVVDAARGLGNGRVLPAGPLRESGSRVRAADAWVMNGGAQGEPVRGVPRELA
ncbi:MAG: tetraacyldisaccharide 4'-kinase, partial [Steroidobacteraceae bacterium]